MQRFWLYHKGTESFLVVQIRILGASVICCLRQLDALMGEALLQGGLAPVPGRAGLAFAFGSHALGRDRWGDWGVRFGCDVV